MHFSKTLGLDFGTSFTTISYLDTQTGKPEVILTPEGAIKTPSVLLFDEKNVYFSQVAMPLIDYSITL